MKYVIKYEIGNWASYVLQIASAFLGLGAYYLVQLFTDTRSPASAAFFGGLMAVIAHELLLMLYIKLTKQYNSYGEWVAGGEGKRDEITPEEQKEKREFRWAVIFFVGLGIAYLLDLVAMFAVVVVVGYFLVMTIAHFLKKQAKDKR